MNKDIEQALWNCGRDRVMHREFGGKPAVAIRWDSDAARVTAPDESRFLVREADTLDEAGEAAARAFAKRLRDIAAQHITQAEAIERSLAHAAVRPTKP